MAKEKIISRIKNILILTVTLSFVIIYIASEAGYFDYIKNRRVSLTSEQIKKFEQDIEEGKVIDIDNYYVDFDSQYHNTFSDLGNNLSAKLRTIVKRSLNKIVKFLNDFLNEE